MSPRVYRLNQYGSAGWLPKTNVSWKKRVSRSGSPPPDVIDEEEFAWLTKLKTSKARYRSAFDSLTEVRNDVEYITGVVEQCRTQLLADFEQWIAAEHPEAAGNVALAVSLHGALDSAQLLPPLGEGASQTLPTGSADSGGQVPVWLLWYLGLTSLLGILYTRTYPNVRV